MNTTLNDTERIALLEARLDELMTLSTHLQDATDTSWVLSSASLVMLMQLGFLMLEAGTVRSHNVIATAAKNVLDFVMGTLLACLCGYWISFDTHPLTIMGNDPGHLHESFLFHVAFQATAATIVSGAMAERTAISAYGIIAFVVSLMYCVGVRLTYGGGWLSDLGFHDFAGSGVVHITGGPPVVSGPSVRTDQQSV